ncbi:MAG TPA: glycosyltransferase [Verrucomicrobiae bacterium]|nr:glycosyltransferase [Verrucomicrobiae bacterium]
MKAWRAVFSIVPDCHVPTGYYRLLWGRHFYDGIRSVVPATVIPEDVDFSWAKTQPFVESDAIRRGRAECSQKIGEQIRRAHDRHGLDAVLSYCFARDLDLGLVRETIQSGIPWVNFFCDSTHLFPEVEPLARVVSLNWFPEGAAIPRYKEIGASVFHRTYAMNPAHLPESGSRSGKHPVVFIGLPSTNRITQLGLLRLLGCPVTIRGHGWVGGGADPFYNAEPAWRRLLRSLVRRGAVEKLVRRAVWPLVRPQARGPLEDAEFTAFLRESRIVLGLNQGRDEHGVAASYLKFRDVEFPGYGCCYLTEHSDDLEEAFEIGKEVLAYRSMASAASHIKRLRDRPELAASIGAKGRKRVLADHTWEVRLRELATAL